LRRLAVPDLTITFLTMTLTSLAADAALTGGRTPRLGWHLASGLAAALDREWHAPCLILYEV
jgi:hypothetical protein